MQPEQHIDTFTSGTGSQFLTKVFHKSMALLNRVVSANKLRILIYHQVVAKHDPMRPTEPTAAIFDWHMRLISQYFTPLSLTAALEHLKKGTLPANAVCITFDDGYLNNLTVAQPILQKYQIPATVYVATGFSQGQNMWNDRIIHLFSDIERTKLKIGEETIQLSDWSQRRSAAYHLLQQLKYLPLAERLQRVEELYRLNNWPEGPALMMTPEQVRELSQKGITIGAHTVNHPILKVLSSEQQYDEIAQSKAELENWLGQPVEHFAYPNGVENRDFDQVAVNHVQQLGFKSAVVTDWGLSNQHTSPFTLKRFTPWDTTAARFHLRLLRAAISRH